MSADPYQRPLEYLREGRLLRGAWTGERDGRETACLLAALSPEVAASHRAEDCPGDLIPAWVAELLPSIDDRTSEERWPELMLALAESIATWGSVTPGQWDRIKAAWLVRVLDLALEQVTTDEWGVREVVERAQQAWRDGDDDAARAAADAAASAARAARAAARAARAAARAAKAAEAAAWAAAGAADAAGAARAVGSADWAAHAAKAAAWGTAKAAEADDAASACASAAARAAWDRLTVDLIEVIEEVRHAGE